MELVGILAAAIVIVVGSHLVGLVLANTITVAIRGIE